MIEFFVSLLLFSQQTTQPVNMGDCDSHCHMNIDTTKFAFVYWPGDSAKYMKRKGSSEGAVLQACSKRVKSVQSDYVFSMFIYTPQFDDTRSNGADSTFTRNLGDKTVQYYRYRADLKWFALITFKSCDTKWITWLYKNEMTAAEEILSGIKMSGTE